MYVVHVYMAAFAIRGSLRSMIDGMKGDEELAELHGLYHRELVAADRSRDHERPGDEEVAHDSRLVEPPRPHCERRAGDLA